MNEEKPNIAIALEIPTFSFIPDKQVRNTLKKFILSDYEEDYDKGSRILYQFCKKYKRNLKNFFIKKAKGIFGKGEIEFMSNYFERMYNEFSSYFRCVKTIKKQLSISSWLVSQKNKNIIGFIKKTSNPIDDFRNISYYTLSRYLFKYGVIAHSPTDILKRGSLTEHFTQEEGILELDTELRFN